MPTLVLIDAAGRVQRIAADEGQSVMVAAATAGVGGIVGECGGSAMCATCHVYVDEAWAQQLPVPLANELEMLECTASERRPTSRLSCQIKVHAALDGIVLRLPASQQ